MLAVNKDCDYNEALLKLQKQPKSYCFAYIRKKNKNFQENAQQIKN